MKRILLHVFCGILITLLISCGRGKAVHNNSQEQGKSGLIDEFVIMAYSGPPPGEITLERFREIAESGIEILVPGNGIFTAEQNLKAMDMAEKVGIRIIPVDMRIMPMALKADILIDTGLIKEVVKDYKDHPALAGYVIKDEPGAALFPALKILSELFLKEDPLHEPLINLFPSYGSPVQLGFDDYRAYIAAFIETVKPRLLSYDNYALREGVTWFESWYSDLAIVREETKKVQVPFIVFVQSEGIKGGLRVPNRAEILWQINTALAYGARGFGWFCYWTPQPDQGFQQEEGAQPPIVESHYNAMIDLHGKRTGLYDFVREANLYLKKAGKGLLSWDNTDVARYEAGKMIEGGSSPLITPSGEHANLVIGTYMKDNRCRMVISNSRCEESAAFSIRTSSKWKISEVYTSICATPAGKDTSFTEWNLEPGGSVVIELTNL
jgi:hypothetical protein